MSWQLRPGTHAARILDFLSIHPDGASDTDIVKALGGGISPQVVNITCRMLEQRKRLIRRHGGEVILNCLVELSSSGELLAAKQVAAPFEPKSRKGDVGTGPDGSPHTWHWEGNVQAAAVQFLVSEGWKVRRVADTASKEPGIDIQAERNGERLWVTVKGCYEGDNRAVAGNWARHSFSSALLDVILWRQEDRAVQIAVALPFMTTYRNLAGRVTWFQKAAGFRFLWVTDQGAAWG